MTLAMQFPIQARSYMPASESRAQAHARLLRDWMADKGLKAPSLALSVERQGQQISPDYIRKLVRGERELSGMPLELREAVRRALRVPAEEWEEATGLATAVDLSPDPIPTTQPGAPISLSARSRALSAASKYGSRYGDIPRRREIEVPDALREAAEQYGHLPMYRGIGERHWQQFMLGASRKATPQDVEGWLREFSDLKRMGYDPDPEEFE